MIFIIPILFLYIAYKIWERFFPAPHVTAAGKYVLITGCDTGFGLLSTVDLARRGFSVIAVCLTEAGVKQLADRNETRITPVRCDVTKEADVAELVRLVARQTDGNLFALVNNAGINRGYFIDASSMSDYEAVMNVNFFAHVRMTKSFLPFIINAKQGRIVNVGSAAGLVAGPGMSCYASSKYAMEAFSDCSRREFVDFGISVSLIEPAFMKTPLVTNKPDFLGLYRSLPSDVQERWGIEMFEMASRGHDNLSRMTEDPQLVITDIVHAVASTRPKPRYKSGWVASTVIVALMSLPTRVQDAVLLGIPKLFGARIIPKAARTQK